MSRERPSFLWPTVESSRGPLLTIGEERFHDVAFFPWRPPANHGKAVADLDLNLVTLGDRFQPPSRRLEAQAAPLAKSETLPNGFGDDQSTRFAQRNGNAHGKVIA